MGFRQFQLKFDAAFGIQVAAFRFEIGAVVRGDVERGKPASNVRLRQYRIGDIVHPRGVDSGVEKGRLAVRAGARAIAGNHQQPILYQQRLAALLFKIAPNFMRAPRESGVFGALAAGQPRNARVAVGRTIDMRRCVFVDAEYALAAFGKLVEAGRAHGAEADNDGVEFFRHRIQIVGRRERWRGILTQRGRPKAASRVYHGLRRRRTRSPSRRRPYRPFRPACRRRQHPSWPEFRQPWLRW